MFTVFEPSEQKVPIKIWLENTSQLDKICLEQAKNLANLPFFLPTHRTHAGCPRRVRHAHRRHHGC